MRKGLGLNKIFLFLISGYWLLVTGYFAYAQGTESITLTTYYPSPYGEYQNLRLFPSNQPACDATKEGLMYYDSTNHMVYYCDNASTWQPLGGSGGAWTRTGTNVNLTNTGDNVGVGTNAPATKLEVATAAKVSGLTNPGTLRLSSPTPQIDFVDTDNSIDWAITANWNKLWFVHSPWNNFDLVIDGANNGNVGIGTGNPMARLDVAGNARITGNITVSGGCTWYAETQTCPAGKVVMGLRPHDSGDTENIFGYTGDDPNGGRPGLYGLHMIFNFDLCCGN